MIYFPEYCVKDSLGLEVCPFLMYGEWHFNGEKISLTELGILCNIDEQELTMLALTYGN